MGKGNRSRIERAMNESVNTDKNVKAKKNKDFENIYYLIVVLFLLFFVEVYGIIDS